MGLSSQCHAPAASPPRRSPGTHCTERWVGLTAGMDVWGEENMSCHHWGLKLELSSL